MKKRLPVSTDNGKTWKSRWVSTNNFDPKNHELKEGDLVKIGLAIHKTFIQEGRLYCSLMKCFADNKELELWINSFPHGSNRQNPPRTKSGSRGRRFNP